MALVQIRAPMLVVLLLLLLLLFFHNRIGIHGPGGGCLLQQHRDVVGEHFVHLVDHILVQLLEVGDVLDFTQHLAILIHIGEVAYSNAYTPRLVFCCSTE